ncbi:TPA: SslE/AcfD family lipoprotein zinc metalloprotease [Vibrio parahaemolyticus]|nr:SslE/AcfD family lipoprotein zinc metalloprotease [Vibrio parahaemolyticus]
MKKTLLSTIVVSLLFGCNYDSYHTDTVVPELPPPPEATINVGLSLDGYLKFVNSSILCNGEPAEHFTVGPSDHVSCVLKADGTPIATYYSPFDSGTDNQARITLEYLKLTDAEEYKDSSTRVQNIQTLIKTMGTIHGDELDLSLEKTSHRLIFKNYLNNQLDVEIDTFKKLLQERLSNDSQTDKQPSTHTPEVEPAVTPGASSDLSQAFVSANAEKSLEYKPKELILTTGYLVDSFGRSVNGIAYFTSKGRGLTGYKDGRLIGDGSLEFSWGDTINFGIDTFELGSTRGNKNTIKLQDLGSGNEGKNIESLVMRFSEENDQSVFVTDKVTEVFSKYPNVINEAISLSLSNEDIQLDLGNGNTEVVKGEFEKQFESGLAEEIDKELGRQKLAFGEQYRKPKQIKAVDSDAQNVQRDVERLWGATQQAQREGWKPVERFHIFHDSTNFYGSTGSARAQAAVNISNKAFPVVMARNDKNYWLDFDKPQAWDENGLAYITEAPSKVKPKKVDASNATFNLPFISIGDLGKGKVMVMGNARYNSVLVCPNGFSWNGGVNDQGQCTGNTDSDDMANFFNNAFQYLAGKKAGTFSVATNIPHVYFKRGGQVLGSKASYLIDKRFAQDTQQLDSFSGLDPNDIPLVILNAYSYLGEQGGLGAYDLPMQANLDAPKLTQQDISDLIAYVEDGGSVLMMETIKGQKDSGVVSRLLDAAGIAFGIGESVARDGNGPNGGYPDRVRSQRQQGIWVLERYAAEDSSNGEGPSLPYVIKEDGSVEWKYIIENRPDDKPKLEVAKWTEINEQGDSKVQVAFIDEANFYQDGTFDNEALTVAKNRILDAFKDNSGKRAYEECTNNEYHYEVNCLEYRPGNKIPISGGLYVPNYTEMKLGEHEAKAMVKAANIGSNIEALYQHERYFRTKGKQGFRLNSVDMSRMYQNLSVWLWNDLRYSYDQEKNDELGFKRFTEFLNCYTDDKAGGNTICPESLKLELQKMDMIYAEGEYAGYMNPSYPLNYMEKPLTRLMLGRSFWDLDVKVDTRQFPGVASSSGSNGGTITLDMSNNVTAWFAGSRQATGQWAQAHVPFTVSVSGAKAPVTITVALADDLTAREKHEVGLKRPPRMTKSFIIGGNKATSETITVPYGGLIYAQGGNSESVQLTFTGTLAAPLFIDGSWKNDLDSPAPVGEVVSKSFIYTGPKANLRAENYPGGIEQFAKDLDQFASDLNDFYARDEGLDGQANRKVTGDENPNSRHHFVNDVAISIGAAHSGYPVMNSSYNLNSSNINTTPLNDWLLWHEVGHNAAEAPFVVEGATEVVNNLLALYMQDLHIGKMTRVEQDIQVAPEFVRTEHGHAWAAGGAAERLVMFAQLKEWAESEFDIRDWYQGELPSYYSEVEGVKGWNLFKLMHRLTRNESDGIFYLKSTNACRWQGLSKSDQLMVCASYAAQTDLSDFFLAWNPGARSFIYPGSSEPSYEGGVTQKGLDVVRKLGLKKPSLDPEEINTITVRK